MATELIPAAPAITVPCVVFALRREAMYFRRAYPVQQLFSGAPCRAQFCGEKKDKKDKRDKRDKKIEKRCQEPFWEKTVPDTFFLMMETGVGAVAMEPALRWFLNGPHFAGMVYRPQFVVSVGFSGALQANLRVGDLVVATEIIDNHGQRWPAICPKEWADRGLAAGRLLTMPKLIGDPRAKQQLGRKYQALAVDMESAIAARFCYEHQVPFACLRVISDDWDTPLSPHLLDLLQQGRVSVPRLAARVLRHPRLIGELWRLAAQTRRAARQLVKPLTDLVGIG